jgi:ABC-2 type transport system ATP-binding protein
MWDDPAGWWPRPDDSVTTQYLDEADQLADRIAVIDRGVVVAEGTADELKATVGNSSLQLAIADPAQLARAREIVEQVLQVSATVSPEARQINAPMTSPDTITDLLVRLREEGISVAELSVQKPTLDEVFLTITGRPAVEEAESQRELEGSLT